MIALPAAPRRGSSFPQVRRLYRRRGALFLIKFLSKLAILGLLPSSRVGVHHTCTAFAPALFAAPAAPYFHLRRGLLFTCTRGAWLPRNRRRGAPIHSMAYCHYLPAVVHKMDPGILAQQSDVSCKRGRLGVIMIAPAANTSKGLAKAFVSSAGGKGAGEPGYSGPLILRSEPRRCPLTCSGSRSKAQGLQLSALGYNVVTRP